MKHDEKLMNDLYKIWRVEESKASRIYEEFGEDFTHPCYIEAEQRSRKALLAFLGQRTASLQHILFKLQIACDVEDYLTDAMNPACTAIAPRAVISAVRDLEGMI